MDLDFYEVPLPSDEELRKEQARYARKVADNEGKPLTSSDNDSKEEKEEEGEGQKGEGEKGEEGEGRTSTNLLPQKQHRSSTFCLEITQQESEYRAKELLAIRGNLLDKRIICTSCGKDLKRNIVEHKGVFAHPMLGVLICEKCSSFYGDDGFSVDEDGSDKYCRWCGDGGSLYCCSFCCLAFCRQCLKRNLNRLALKDIESEDWKCLVCKPQPLWKLRALCTATQEYMKKTGRRRKVLNKSNLQGRCSQRKTLRKRSTSSVSSPSVHSDSEEQAKACKKKENYQLVSDKNIPDQHVVSRRKKTATKRLSLSEDISSSKMSKRKTVKDSGAGMPSIKSNKSSIHSSCSELHDRGNGSVDGSSKRRSKKHSGESQSPGKEYQSIDSAAGGDSVKVSRKSAKKACLWLQEACNDISKISEFTSLQSHNLCTKEVNIINMTDISKVSEFVGEIRFLIKCSTKNLLSISKNLKTTYDSWLRKQSKRLTNEDQKIMGSEPELKRIESIKEVSTAVNKEKKDRPSVASCVDMETMTGSDVDMEDISKTKTSRVEQGEVNNSDNSESKAGQVGKSNVEDCSKCKAVLPNCECYQMEVDDETIQTMEHDTASDHHELQTKSKDMVEKILWSGDVLSRDMAGEILQSGDVLSGDRAGESGDVLSGDRAGEILESGNVLSGDRAGESGDVLSGDRAREILESCDGLSKSRKEKFENGGLSKDSIEENCGSGDVLSKDRDEKKLEKGDVLSKDEADKEVDRGDVLSKYEIRKIVDSGVVQSEDKAGKKSESSDVSKDKLGKKLESSDVLSKDRAGKKLKSGVVLSKHKTWQKLDSIEDKTGKKLKRDDVLSKDKAEKKLERDDDLSKDKTEKKLGGDDVPSKERAQQKLESGDILSKDETRKRLKSGVVLSKHKAQKKLKNIDILSKDKKGKNLKRDDVLSEDKAWKKLGSGDDLSKDKAEKKFERDVVLSKDKTKKKLGGDEVPSKEGVEQKLESGDTLSKDKVEKKLERDDVLSKDKTKKKLGGDEVPSKERIEQELERGDILSKDKVEKKLETDDNLSKDNTEKELQGDVPSKERVEQKLESCDILSEDETGKILESGDVLSKDESGKILESGDVLSKDESRKILESGDVLSKDKAGKILESGDVLSKDESEKILESGDVLSKDKAGKILESGDVLSKDESGKILESGDVLSKDKAGKIFESGDILSKDKAGKILESCDVLSKDKAGKMSGGENIPSKDDAGKILESGDVSSKNESGKILEIGDVLSKNKSGKILESGDVLSKDESGKILESGDVLSKDKAGKIFESGDILSKDKAGKILESCDVLSKDKAGKMSGGDDIPSKNDAGKILESSGNRCEKHDNQCGVMKTVNKYRINKEKNCPFIEQNTEYSLADKSEYESCMLTGVSQDDSKIKAANYSFDTDAETVKLEFSPKGKAIYSETAWCKRVEVKSSVQGYGDSDTETVFNVSVKGGGSDSFIFVNNVKIEKELSEKSFQDAQVLEDKEPYTNSPPHSDVCPKKEKPNIDPLLSTVDSCDVIKNERRRVSAEYIEDSLTARVASLEDSSDELSETSVILSRKKKRRRDEKIAKKRKREENGFRNSKRKRMEHTNHSNDAGKILECGGDLCEKLDSQGDVIKTMNKYSVMKEENCNFIEQNTEDSLADVGDAIVEHESVITTSASQGDVQIKGTIGDIDDTKAVKLKVSLKDFESLGDAVEKSVEPGMPKCKKTCESNKDEKLHSACVVLVEKMYSGVGVGKSFPEKNVTSGEISIDSGNPYIARTREEECEAGDAPGIKLESGSDGRLVYRRTVKQGPARKSEIRSDKKCEERQATSGTNGIKISESNTRPLVLNYHIRSDFGDRIAQWPVVKCGNGYRDLEMSYKELSDKIISMREKLSKNLL